VPSCAVDVRWCLFLVCPSFITVLSFICVYVYIYFFSVCVRYTKIIPNVVKKVSVMVLLILLCFHDLFFLRWSVPDLKECILREIII